MLRGHRFMARASHAEVLKKDRPWPERQAMTFGWFSSTLHFWEVVAHSANLPMGPVPAGLRSHALSPEREKPEVKSERCARLSRRFSSDLDMSSLNATAFYRLTVSQRWQSLSLDRFLLNLADAGAFRSRRLHVASTHLQSLQLAGKCLKS